MTTMRIPTVIWKMWFSGFIADEKTRKKITIGCSNERSKLHAVFSRKTPFMASSSIVAARNPPKMNAPSLARVLPDSIEYPIPPE